jgi:hypothetical protein
LDVEYKLLKRGRIFKCGSGSTLDISSSGVLFEAKDTQHSTGEIELTLQWPFLLDGACPLKLVIQGHVVGNRGKRIAVSIKHYEFYIAKKALSPGWCTKSKNKPKDGH